jgi:hypothetical protein
MSTNVSATRRPSPSWLRILAFAAYFILAIAVGLEVLLRLFPNVIPLRLLTTFDDELRLEIAQKLGMPTHLAVRKLVRDDGGPPLFIGLPNVKLDMVDHRPESETGMLDERGFCNPPSLGGPPFDLITIGGSISWCVAISPEKTWTARVGQMLGIKAYNMSVPGVGPFEYLQALKQFGLPLKPRMVIMDFSGGNDLRDVIRFDDYRSGHAGDHDGGAALNVVASREDGGFLARHSYLYALTRAAVERRFGNRGGTGPRHTWKVPGKHSTNFHFRLHWGDQSVACNTDNGDPEEPHYGKAVQLGLIDLKVLREPLEILAKLAKENHFTPILTYTPAIYTVYGDAVEFEDPSLAAPLRALYERQRDYLSSAAAELGIHFIDLTPPLQAAAEKLKGSDILYITGNLHLTASGQRVIAEALAARLPEFMPH